MNPADRGTILQAIRAELPYLRARFGVEKIALFGSFARGAAGQTSDIDLMVSLTRPLGLEFVNLADYLEERLGRKVDLLTATSLDRGLQDPRRAHIARNIQDSLIYA